jgi:hypothetical protein
VQLGLLTMVVSLPGLVLWFMMKPKDGVGASPANPSQPSENRLP